MKKIALVGSRTWADPQAVALKVNDLYSEHGEFMVISGGADGACQVAETTAMEFGFPVISFRPVKIDDERYGVDEWRLHKGQGKVVRDPGTWADWKSAAFFRSMLIAERARDGAVAFWDGFSYGTAFEIDLFRAAGVEPEIIKPA